MRPRPRQITMTVPLQLRWFSRPLPDCRRCGRPVGLHLPGECGEPKP